MKLPKPFLLTSILTSAVFATAPMLHAEEKAAPAKAAVSPKIIDTKFDVADDQGRPILAAPPSAPGDPTLTAPTALADTGSDPDHPTTIRVGKEKLGDLPAPYALMTIGSRPGKAEATGNGAIQWKLDKLRLQSGIYEINYTVLPRQADKSGGRFRVAFKSITPGVAMAPLHPNLQPATIAFRSDGIYFAAGGKTTRNTYQADQSLKFQLRLDLDQHLWSAKVNGEPWLVETPFPESLKTGPGGDFIIDALEFSCVAGNGDPPTRPGPSLV